MKETFEREVARAEWRAIVEAHYDRIASEILAERRAGNPDWRIRGAGGSRCG
jgi:hypothetical protein